VRRSSLAEPPAGAKRFAPATVEALCEVLARANAEQIPLEIAGANTLGGMGSPARASTIVTTLALNALIAHEDADLTCAMQSGITLSAFDKTLAQHRQFVPLDAPLRTKATIGGTVASGWLSPRRHLYGRARDLIIGTEIALVNGTLAHAGGMVVKNVTGYDMSKLYAGSFGTLGVLTRVNFKTLPLPRARRALLAKLPENTRARAAAQLTALSVIPAATIFVEGFRKNIEGADGIDGRTFVLLEGSEALLERGTREIRTALGRAGVPETTIFDMGCGAMLERIADACVASLGQRSITYRSLGLADSAMERATRLRDAANRQRLFTDLLFDANNGDVFVRLSDRDSRGFAAKIEQCHDELRAIDPRLTIVAGEAPIRAALDPWGEPPPAISYMRKLKAQFDRHNILNPGRFIVG